MYQLTYGDWTKRNPGLLYSGGYHVVINATFVEGVAGRKGSGEAELKFYKTDVKLAFPDYNPQTFKPGLQYIAQVGGFSEPLPGGHRLFHVVLSFLALFCSVLCCAVLCCAVLNSVVLCCAVPCCAALRCVVLCCALLCHVISGQVGPCYVMFLCCVVIFRVNAPKIRPSSSRFHLLTLASFSAIRIPQLSWNFPVNVFLTRRRVLHQNTLILVGAGRKVSVVFRTHS